MKRYIVIGLGDDFVEGMYVMADSFEDAAFRASKDMRATESCLVFLSDDPELAKFVTDNYNGDDDGFNYILKSTEGVCVGWTHKPFYYNQPQPHDMVEVCEAINRLVNPKKASTSHVILGTKLPSVTMCSSCYYCGTDTSDVYF